MNATVSPSLPDVLRVPTPSDQKVPKFSAQTAHSLVSIKLKDGGVSEAQCVTVRHCTGSDVTLGGTQKSDETL